MENSSISHHGILGQRWGHRRFQNRDGTLTSLGKKKKAENKTMDEKSDIKSMSDEELRKKINRLDLENRYSNLMKNSYPPEKTHAGRKFVSDVLKRSGQNIAEQTTTYILGTAVNKIAGKQIVNPKKGQKK